MAKSAPLYIETDGGGMEQLDQPPKERPTVTVRPRIPTPEWIPEPVMHEREEDEEPCPAIQSE